jgi:hypothetical protein
VREKKPDGKTPKIRPFSDVDMPRQFPAEDVADHQVFMSFTNDSDAIAFHEWWGTDGVQAFAEWLHLQREEDK